MKNKKKDKPTKLKMCFVSTKWVLYFRSASLETYKKYFL